MGLEHIKEREVVAFNCTAYTITFNESKSHLVDIHANMTVHIC